MPPRRARPSTVILDVLIFLACILPGVRLSARDSRWLLPYVLAVWAFGPEVRRVVDFMLGSYRSVTILSVMQLAASLLLIPPIWRSHYTLSRGVRNGMFCIGAAVLYATGVGLGTSPFAAVYEALLFVCPMLVMPYAALRPFRTDERDLWIASFSTIAAVVAAYGWYQFINAPPWDMFWLRESGMIGSSGNPEAQGFRLFSTLNSAGPLAIFLTLPLVIALGGRQWRGPLGLLGTALIGTVLIVARVRVGWLLAGSAIATYLAVARGTRRAGAIAVVLIVGACVTFVLPMLPGFDAVTQRASSFQDIFADASVQGRMEMSKRALQSEVADNPFGRGLGGTGVGEKLAVKGGGSGGFDNGYVDLLLNYGAPMTLLLLMGVALIFNEAIQLRAIPSVARFGWLATAAAVAFAISTLAYNLISAVMGLTLWLVVACALRPAEEMAVQAMGESRRSRNRLKRFVARRVPAISVLSPVTGSDTTTAHDQGRNS